MPGAIVWKTDESCTVMRIADFGEMPVGAEVCGIDEAGRGPLAGPVAAGAVILPADFPVGMLRDSKALRPAAREQAYAEITARAVAWSVGWATPGEIGALDILRATMLAMRRAYFCLGRVPGMVFVDGNRGPGLGRQVVAAIGGDAFIPAVMAASILAKVARDRVMSRLDAVSPGYGFARHKGYPTLAHRRAIAVLGPSLWQRPGFRITPPEDS